MQSELDTIGCVLQSFYGAVFRELFFPFSFFFRFLVPGFSAFCFSAFLLFPASLSSLLLCFSASLLPRFCFSASSSSSLFCFFVPLLLRFSASLLFAAFLPLKPKLNKPQP